MSPAAPRTAATSRCWIPAAIRAEVARGGKLELGLGQVLRLRIRHLTAGVIPGSKEFIDDTFLKHRDRFGAQPIRGAPWLGINAVRDLRTNALG